MLVKSSSCLLVASYSRTPIRYAKPSQLDCQLSGWTLRLFFVSSEIDVRARDHLPVCLAFAVTVFSLLTAFISVTLFIL
jgi:hypothetical protein